MAIGLRGDDDDRHLAGRPQAAHQVKSVNTRQSEIDEDDVGLLVLNDQQSLLRGCCFEDPIPLVFEVGTQHHPNGVVVLDDHDGANHRYGSTPQVRPRAVLPARVAPQPTCDTPAT